MSSIMSRGGNWRGGILSFRLCLEEQRGFLVQRSCHQSRRNIHLLHNFCDNITVLIFIWPEQAQCFFHTTLFHAHFHVRDTFTLISFIIRWLTFVRKLFIHVKIFHRVTFFSPQTYYHFSRETCYEIPIPISCGLYAADSGKGRFHRLSHIRVKLHLALF